MITCLILDIWLDVWWVAFIGMCTLLCFSAILLILIVLNQKRFVLLRRASEERLRESEESLRTLIDCSPVPTLIHDESRILFANTAAATLLGGSAASDLAGHSLESFFALAGSGKSFEDRSPSGHTTSPREIVRRLRRLDGSFLNIETLTLPILFEGKEASHSTVYRVAERSRIEERVLDIPRKILDAQERERRRVAQDLHDGANQILRSIRFRLAEFVPYLHAPDNIIKEIRRIGNDLEYAADEINRMSHNLLPSHLEHLGLLAALRSLGDDFSRSTGIPVTYKFIGVPDRFDTETELALFRIIRECLNNIDKHARADAVNIELDMDASCIIAIVQDNGNGFTNMSISSANGFPLGLGIHTMKERAACLHGNVSIESAPFEGTKVVAIIPLSSSPAPRFAESSPVYAI